MALTQVDQGLLGQYAQYTGFKNRIINGGMMIDQRNAGAVVTPTANGYTLDRWRWVLAQASKFSTQQSQGGVTPPTGFKNYLGATSLSAYSVLAGDYFFLQQVIEGFNVADFGWGTSSAVPVTLSFWVRSSLTGTFGGSLQNGGFGRSYPFIYTVNAANTWEQKTVTVAGDTTGVWATDNTAGLKVQFGIGCGSTYSGTAGAWASAEYYSATGATSVVGTAGATFYITGVQLEKGSTATSFDYRPYGTELALCQRYFQALTTFALSYTTSVVAGYQYLTIYFPTIMRASPTYSLQSGSWLGATPTFEGATTSNARLYNATTGFYSNGTVVTAFSAEL